MSTQAQTKPRVSILIPVYNTAQYLPRCLASVQNQTLHEIEIIVVNDASPDNAAEVLAEYAAKDSRIRIVTHEKNGGILAARLSGIAAATGDYLIFLDADDYLSLDCAKLALEKAESTGADMVHFEFEVLLPDGTSSEVTREIRAALAPYNGTLLDGRVFEGAFVDRLYRWNICGKFIAADVCRQAAAELPPGYYIMAEDFCFYSMMAYHATHYEPLFRKCYYYGLNLGVSAYTLIGLKGFERACSVFTALNAVRTFLTRKGVFQRYRVSFDKQQHAILGDLMDRWEHKLIEADQSAGFDLMFERYRPQPLLRVMADYFHDLEQKFARMTGIPAALRRPPQPPRHIGIYLDKIAHSDFAESMLAAARGWQEAGYRVTLLTGAEPEADDPALPEKMQRLRLPGRLAGIDRAGILRRVDAWPELLREHAIDTVVHAATESGRFIWDLLAVKFAGAAMIAVPRVNYNTLADGHLGDFLLHTRCLALSDAVAARSALDELWYRARQARAVRVAPAPVEPVPAERSGQELLWLGEFGDPRQIHDLVNAWAEAAAAYPGALLLLPQAGNLPAPARSLGELIGFRRLQDSIRFLDTEDELKPLLRTVRAAVLTAAPDRFPRQLALLQSCGIPLVTYGSGGECRSVPELAEALRNALAAPAGQLPVTPADPAGNREWRQLFEQLPALTVPAVSEDARLLGDDLFRTLDAYAVAHEPYYLAPPAEGDNVIAFHRMLDRAMDKFFPVGTPRRRRLFRTGKRLLGRFKK